MPTKNSISVVLTGGGTGGHIYPAIAVAQLLKVDPLIKHLYYIGCDKNIEKDIVAREGIEFYSVNMSGMPRKFSIKFILWLFKLSVAVIKSIFYLRKLKPDVVFGTGGYVTAPVLMASRFLKIPYIIHDPDAHPGIVNRYMANGAAVVSTAFEQAQKYLKAKQIKVFGNPVRMALSANNRGKAIESLGLSSDKKTILVIGGSQGAKTINNAIKDAFPQLINNGFQIIHQTGKKNYEEYITNFFGRKSEKNPEKNPEKCFEISQEKYLGYIVKPYFDDMSIPLNAADLAISRAGSLSISELNLCGLPSVLVPYPYAAANHQFFNAKAMEEAGAAICLEDAECTAERLIELINIIFSRHNSMREANLSLAKPMAAHNITDEIKNIALK